MSGAAFPPNLPDLPTTAKAPPESNAEQFLRACSLTVSDMQGNGIEFAGPDLDQTFRIRFSVAYQLTTTPCNLHARIYNLRPETIQKLVNFASKDPPTGDGLTAFATSAQVVLKAGYQRNLGQIFKGQIFQYRVGYEK